MKNPSFYVNDVVCIRVALARIPIEKFKATGVEKALVHFDVDVLDPDELVIASVKALTQVGDVVALTFPQHLPIAEI